MSVLSHKVLVTGGAGFIGSHLCQRLLERGDEVICLDVLFTGTMRNIEKCQDHEAFTFVKQDVCEPFDFEVDRIFNLACPASPVHYQYNPVHTTETSFLGALNSLRLAERRGARILQASTSEVYGDPLEHPQREEYRGNVNINGPRSCYDEGKRVAETLFSDFRRTHGVDARIVRIFNTYGPNMHPNDGRVVSNFIVQALRGEDVTVYGDGSQTRSFCYVSDLVEGLLRMMDADEAPLPVNLGNPSEVTVRELAERIIALMGSESKIITAPLPTDDPVRRKPDISRARKLLDWQPVVPLDEGLTSTIAYFRELLDA